MPKPAPKAQPAAFKYPDNKRIDELVTYTVANHVRELRTEAIDEACHHLLAYFDGMYGWYERYNDFVQATTIDEQPLIEAVGGVEQWANLPETLRNKLLRCQQAKHEDLKLQSVKLGVFLRQQQRMLLPLDDEAYEPIAALHQAFEAQMVD